MYDYKCPVGHWTVRIAPIAAASSAAPCGYRDSREYATTGCNRIAHIEIGAPAVKVAGGTGANYVKR